MYTNRKKHCGEKETNSGNCPCWAVMTQQSKDLLDGVAMLIADPATTNSTLMHGNVAPQDRN